MITTFTLLLAAAVSTSVATTLLETLPVGPIAPTVIPAKPHPNWDWSRIPTSYHGAVKDREFSDTEVERLAKYQMITIEKWYTPCASKGPTQSGPTCGVESKIEGLFKKTRALAPNQTTNMYWNSMLDFSFYTAHQGMLDLEERGVHAFLRDETGKVISLCNDGDVYCNITTFDWTSPEVRALWIETVMNATATGLVDGIFADHSAVEDINIGTDRNGQMPNQLCNGVAGKGRACYNFTDTFKASFNSWHMWVTNYTQDVLSRSTGGPVIQGPMATMNGVLPMSTGYAVNYCDFDAIRRAQTTSDFVVIEARGECIPSEKCLAAYLAAAEPFTYVHCTYNGDDLLTSTEFPEMNKPLGAPLGPATEIRSGVWSRKFASGTLVEWDNTKQTGTVTWGSITL